MNSQAPKSNFQAKTNFSDEFLQEISEFEPKFDEPIAPFSTWRCGGPADILVIAKNATELEKLVILAIENEIPYTILGHASNILISDNGIRGLVIINKSRKVKIMEKPNLIKQEEYSYYLHYFDKITEDYTGEFKLENSKINLNSLKKIWNISTLEDLFNSYQIETTEQSEYFEKILDSKLELDKYDYFLELNLIENEKTKTSQINLIFDIYGVVLKDNWLNSEIVQTVDFIKQNHEFYNFYYLSNITKEQFAEFEKLEIFSYFSGGIASFTSDFEKPNSEIFGELLDKFDLKPETSIFIDDTERNVEMAEKIGINSVIFSYQTDLAKEIEKIRGEITTKNCQKSTKIKQNQKSSIDQIINQIEQKIAQNSQKFETKSSQSQENEESETYYAQKELPKIRENEVACLTKMPQNLAQEIVEIKPFNPETTILADGIITQIQNIFPDLKVLNIGSSALEIAGNNDLNLQILSSPEKYPIYLPKLIQILGEPKNSHKDLVEWRFKKEGIDIEVYLTDQNSQEFKRQLRVFEILKTNLNLKIGLTGKNVKDYTQVKFEFFNKILENKETQKPNHAEKKHQQNIDFIKKEIKKVKNLDLENAKVEFFASGQCNDLYLVAKDNFKYLAKITNWQQNKIWKIKQEEFEKLQFIEHLAISPKCYYYDICNSKDIHWNLVDFMEGELLETFDEQKIVQIAEILQKLHNNTISEKFGERWNELENAPYKCYVLDEYTQKYPEITQKSNFEPLKQKFEEINWQCNQFCLIHNDLKILNMVEKDGKIGLIDWEYAYFDIPENDVARFFVENNFDSQQKKLFLDNYLPLKNINFDLERLQTLVEIYEFFDVAKQVIQPIYNEIKQNSNHKKPFIVAIDGRDGSGKSTLADKISQNFKTQIIKTDDFITFFKPEIADKDYYWDKNRFLEEVLLPLKNKQSFKYNVCRWKTGEITREERIDQNNELIIVEGLHALHQDLLDFYDLKIWVNTPLEISLERGKIRDLEKGKKNIDELWSIFVPFQESYISEHKPQEKADLVISTENGEYQIVKNNSQVLLETQIVQNSAEFDIYITPRHSETGDPNFYSFADLDYTETGNGENNQEIPLEKSEIIFDSGVDLSFAIAWSLQNNLTGLQWFAGIPGTMGGALYNNIHGGTRHFSDNFVSCKVLIPEIESENLPN